MIESKYILDILDLAVDEYVAEHRLRKQIDCLTLRDTEHTGIGLYINFTPDNKIKAIKIEIGESTEVLTGHEIKVDSENIVADAIVHLKDGIINYLELFNKNGEAYRQLNLYIMNGLRTGILKIKDAL